jgi:hypothetical protein
MSLDLQQISPELKATLMDLKNMAPMRRFAEVSRPRFELKWKTVAYEYGIEKLERNGWVIPEEELGGNPKSLKHGGSPHQAKTGLAGGPYRGTEETEESLAPISADEAATGSDEARPDPRQAGVDATGLDEVGDGWEAVIPEDRQEAMSESARMDTELAPITAAKEDQAKHDMEIWQRAWNYAESQLSLRIERDVRRRLGAPEPWLPQEDRATWYKKQLAKLEKADAAPRCAHIYSDGTRCRAPRLKTGDWCYAHERMKAVRPEKLKLLPMEDANSIMLNLMEIGRALCDDEISEKKAALLLSNQRLALAALKRMTFRETNGELMVTEVKELPESKELPRSPGLAKSKELPRSPGLAKSKELPRSPGLPKSKELPESPRLPKSPKLKSNSSKVIGATEADQKTAGNAHRALAEGKGASVNKNRGSRTRTRAQVERQRRGTGKSNAGVESCKSNESGVEEKKRVLSSVIGGSRARHI